MCVEIDLFFFAEIYDETVVLYEYYKKKKYNYFIILNDSLYHICDSIKYFSIRLDVKVKAQFLFSFQDILSMYARMHISSILLFLSIQPIFLLFYLYTFVCINEKNAKLSKDLMTVGRIHKTNVVMSILIKSSFDDVNEQKMAEIPASANRQRNDELNNDVIVLPHPYILYTQLSICLQLTFSLILSFHHLCTFNFSFFSLSLSHSSCKDA